MLVGKYGKYYTNRLTAETTKQIVTGLSAAGNYEAGQDIYSKVYAAIKPGDALLFRTTDGGGYGHVRLVIGVNIVYKDAAKTQVDPAKSYVNCIEQAGFSKTQGVTGRPPGFQTMKTVAESTLVNIILLNLQVKREPDRK